MDKKLEEKRNLSGDFKVPCVMFLLMECLANFLKVFVWPHLSTYSRYLSTHMLESVSSMLASLLLAELFFLPFKLLHFLLCKVPDSISKSIFFTKLVPFHKYYHILLAVGEGKISY